jgi:hypothetical protein
MAQELEPPTYREAYSSLGRQILLSLKDRQLPVEQVLELTDADRNETLSTITKLIADGYLELVIL